MMDIPAAPENGDFDLSGFLPEGGTPPPNPQPSRPPRPARPASDRPSDRKSGGYGAPRRGGSAPDRFRREGPREPRSYEPRPQGYAPRREGGSRPPLPRGNAPRSYPPAGGEKRWTPRPPGSGFGPGAGRDDADRIAPEVKKFLPLTTEKGRYRASRFILEGAKNIADAIAISPGVIFAVLAARGYDDDKLAELFRKNRIKVEVVHPRDLAALCDTETPQGVVAIANFAALRPDWNTARYVTLLDGIQDPGNVGSILRTSAALGMDAVVFGKGTCDAYNPKVVRSSASSLLRLPVETGEDLGSKIHFLRTKGFSVVATSPHAKLTMAQAKLRRKVALIFGNEGAGVGENLLDQADVAVRIPMPGKVESLNVAVTHGLLTYELLRLRDQT